MASGKSGTTPARSLEYVEATLSSSRVSTSSTVVPYRSARTRSVSR
jgi:hypothetical protein